MLTSKGYEIPKGFKITVKKARAKVKDADNRYYSDLIKSKINAKYGGVNNMAKALKVQRTVLSHTINNYGIIAKLLEDK